MSGICYGIGVGPGDPELLTFKAVRTAKECAVAAVVVSDMEYARCLCRGQYEEAEVSLDHCVAYQILLAKLPELVQKRILYLPFPMTKDEVFLSKCHNLAAGMVLGELEKGLDVAFLTLGDPTIYSTYLYVQTRIQEQGYQTEMVPGIPSFCAAAARLRMGLVENKEQLHILPASYDLEQGLSLPGTKVLMKAGRQLQAVKQAVTDKGLRVSMVENCGMVGEQLYPEASALPERAGYYSLLIVKGEK